MNDQNALPPGFWRTFRKERTKVGDLYLNTILGGTGPPLLLIGGWPQTWHAWRRVIPDLAGAYSVVVAEPRGFGESDKPRGRYDLTTVARELVDLMDQLGHRGPFNLAGHDVGAWIGYAMAADHPGRVARLALIDSAIPGVTPPPSVLAPELVNNRVWHLGFNRLGPELNEALVRGREEIFFGWQFRTKAGRPGAVPASDIALYVEAYKDSDTLRAGFDYYRAIETNIAENAVRVGRKLEMPILVIAGERGVGRAFPPSRGST